MLLSRRRSIGANLLTFLQTSANIVFFTLWRIITMRKYVKKTNQLNYQTCTLQELADHVEKSPTSRISAQLAYYCDTGNSRMVERIIKARGIVRRRKMLKRMAAKAAKQRAADKAMLAVLRDMKDMSEEDKQLARSLIGGSGEYSDEGVKYDSED
jgi:hypothetical protein